MSKNKNIVYKKQNISFANNLFNNKYFIKLLAVFYMKHYNIKNPIDAQQYVKNVDNRNKMLQQYVLFNKGEAITEDIIDFNLLNMSFENNQQ